ncbi:unnamed protein product [Merluccius merluccius]
MVATLRWTAVGIPLVWILVWSRTAVRGEAVRCPGSAAGETLHPVRGLLETLHPVRGLLETPQAGPGCAARERGNRETHVVAVGRPTHGDQVTVVLRPLTPPPAPDRTIILLLISKQPVHWMLEPEGLDPLLSLLVQVSSNSTVVSPPALDVRLQRLHSLLPFPPHKLLSWVRGLHGSLSSMTHAARANRAYARLGEDPTAPRVCRLQPLFLSPHYLTSDLQLQEVRGCVPLAGNWTGGKEVHVIKVVSAGSALCGSLQVEVVVSLVPPVADSGPHKVVLVLSSLVPVHWALLAPGLHGDVSVHSSTSVSPPYPLQPHLSFSSAVTSDLSADMPDLLAWANERGFTAVTSYTEASLSNRFVIRLAGGGTEAGSAARGAAARVAAAAARAPWPEEDQLRQWLRGGAGGAETLAVCCDDGRLNVALDTHILQVLSVPVVAVTLRDPACRAQSNGSHFLLAFPVGSCGTEAALQGRPRGVQYRNTVFIWREPPHTLTTNDTHTAGPLGIHISCFSASPPVDDDVTSTPWGGGDSQDPGSGGGGLLPAPRPRAGPVLVLRLFVSESFQQSRIGPCVVIADHRVYVEISSTGPVVAGALELSSCVVSPVSDPQSAPYWPIIRYRCPAHPSLTLTQLWGEGGEGRQLGGEDKGGEGGGGDGKGGAGGEAGVRGGGGGGELRGADELPGGGAPDHDPSAEKTQDGGVERKVREEEKETQSLRFSFVLRPVYNNSVQFLHCRLLLCSSSSSGEEGAPRSQSRCQDGGDPIPRLASSPPGPQCEERNLTRPMVVTHPLSAEAGRPLAPPAGQQPLRPSISQLSEPSPDSSSAMLDVVQFIGIVSTAFVMGIVLMGALCCIYTRTGTKPPAERRFCVVSATQQQNGNYCNLSPPELTGQSDTSM